jgi:triosephosphate isomerase
MKRELVTKLAKIHEEVAKETGANIQIVVQAVDIAKISQEVDIPIIAQHIDPIKYGSSTGHILPESVKMAGAVGTLINHSEKRLEREIIRKTVERAKDVGLITIICAATAEEGATFVEFNPDYIAVEPPELIGDPNISVATAKPEVIKKAVELVRPIKLLVGAGVKDGRDVKISMELGAQGVLLASAIARSKDPKALLLDLASGLG